MRENSLRCRENKFKKVLASFGFLELEFRIEIEKSVKAVKYSFYLPFSQRTFTV